MRTTTSLLPVFLTILSAGLRAETVAVADRGALARALQAAKPGDVIRLAPGEYAGGLMVSGIAGTKDRPVVVEAADAAKPPVIRGGASGMQLSGCSWVVLRGLHLTGATANGLNIDDGGAGRPPAMGIVLDSLVVANAAPEGNRDGIKLSGLEGFTVRGCRIERWGAGGSGIDMVGCRKGTVEGCTLRHDGAAAAGANGVQMKGGSEDIVVRRCRFLGAGGRGVNLGGSTGAPYFRPPGAAFEARNLTVEDCLFRDTQAAVAFVGVTGAVVRHNTIIDPGRWALRILQENRAPGMARCAGGEFSRNVVVFRSDALREAVNIGPDTDPATFRFEGNAWHCEDRPGDTARLVRLPSREVGGMMGRRPMFRGDDGTQTPDSPASGAGVRAAK